MTAMTLPARFAFYGTLRIGGGALERLGLVDSIEHLGPCLIPGRLYAVSWYPGLVMAGDGGDGVVGDLFAVPDAATVGVVDRFEGFDVADPAGSLFRRELVSLLVPGGEAWTYLWNGSIEGRALVPGGDWLRRRRHDRRR